MKKITTDLGIIHYHDLRDLQKFNRKLYFHGQLKQKFKTFNIMNTEDETYYKLQIISRKADNILRPTASDSIIFDVIILHDKTEVSERYEEIYHEKKSVKGFYRRTTNTVYLSAKNANLEVVSHELGHVYFFKAIGEIYFSDSFHELAAQYVSNIICS